MSVIQFIPRHVPVRSSVESTPRAGVSRIEIWGRPAGFAAPFRDGVRFIANTPEMRLLDGAFFPTLGHARLAAIARARHTPGYAEGWED